MARQRARTDEEILCGQIRAKFGEAYLLAEEAAKDPTATRQADQIMQEEYDAFMAENEEADDGGTGEESSAGEPDDDTTHPPRGDIDGDARTWPEGGAGSEGPRGGAAPG